MSGVLVVADLDATRIARMLETRTLGHSLELRAVTASTSDDARGLAYVDGHVVVADAQTAGRGTHGRVWSSPPGLDLYFSFVLRQPPAPAITLAIGLGLAKAIDALTARETCIKWPNDVLLADQKCAGILVETSSGADFSIAGVGINVNRTSFDVAGATSMKGATGTTFDRTEVLCRVLESIETELDRFREHGPEAIARDLAPKLAWRGEHVRCGDAAGVLAGIAPSGALLIATSGGERSVVAGRLERA